MINTIQAQNFFIHEHKKRKGTSGFCHAQQNPGVIRMHEASEVKRLIQTRTVMAQ